MNPQLIYDIYAIYFVPLCALVPVYYGIKNYKFLIPSLKILLNFIVVSSLINLVNLIMISRHMHTVKLIHLYTIVEFFFITLAFSRIFSRRVRPLLYALIALFTIACTFNTFFIQNKIEYNSYTRPVGALIIVLYCMSYIIKTGTEERKWTEDSFNWINSGLLLYYASGVVMFMFNNYLLKWDTWALVIWTIIDTILLIEYILFAIGFYKCKLPTTTIQLS
ncbi:hypothetical protein CKK33_18045 [Mucilaginibacter sp. MD40]|nr:hypothetical protein CKK33_18045 [Mucilaginibacter sp. MD40]